MASSRKRKFTYAQRYAIWKSNEGRCGLCPEPLRLFETTVDHFFPESLLKDRTRREAALLGWGLPLPFNIDDYENWHPAHGTCNSKKRTKLPVYSISAAEVLQQIRERAPQTAKEASRIAANAGKDRVLASLFTAVEQGKLSLLDLQELIDTISRNSADAGFPAYGRLLDQGQWVRDEDVAAEGLCTCERASCVDADRKVYCWWTRDLSEWVLTQRLHRKCYDEVISCARCGAQHVRGHTGWSVVCRTI